jgi:DNA-binding PadR family transcriptional regulator
MGISWNRRKVGVPKGLLRFLVLKMISEKPMSGAEIVDEIEKQTGTWKPSSGSIYPLLASLHKRGFTKELPKDALGLKRYSYTEKGKKFLKNQIIFGKEFIEKIEFLAPMLVGGFNLENDNKKFLKTNESVKKLVRSFIALRHNLNRLSEKDAKELAEILEESSAKIERIVQRNKNEK